MGLKDTVLPQIPNFEAYTPGLAVDEIRDKYGLADVIKLASNENPLGTSPVVQRALTRNADMAFRYAQAGTPKLNAAIAKKIGVPEQCIVTGNGSDEIIDLLVRVKARPGVDNIIAFDPCFSVYKLQAKLCGVEFRQTKLNSDFSFDWDALLKLADENTALCFVTTPDNPSGYAPRVEELETLAKRLPEQCLLVIDEAYMDFVEDQDAYSLLSRREEFPNIAFLRTFSKMYGLAGMRLGYGVLPEWLADYCLRVKLPFSVNILAEIAGIAALSDTTFVEETMRVVTTGREYLTEQLKKMGFVVWPSKANFLLVDMPADAPFGAKEFVEKMLRCGIILRPLGSYNLPRSLRITIGNERENNVFIETAREILAHG